MFEKLVAILGGVIASPLIKALKDYFDLKDFWAWGLSAVIYTVFALFALLIVGGLPVADVTWENLSGLVIIVLSVAHTIFQAGKSKSLEG